MFCFLGFCFLFLFYFFGHHVLIFCARVQRVKQFIYYFSFFLFAQLAMQNVEKIYYSMW